MSLTSREKEKLLRALEEDREFRYALMGLLGYKEILERITRLEERFARLEERFAKLEERQQRLEEKFAELEARQQKLEERFARLEERFAKLEERQQRLEEEMIKTRRVLMIIAHRFGILSEAGLREALKYVVQEVLGVAAVERRTVKDDGGIVYGHPAVVEIDVVVRDGEHILVEIKSRVSRSDVAELYRVGIVYEKIYGVRPKLLIIGGFIDSDAISTASRLNVELRPVVEVERGL